MSGLSIKIKIANRVYPLTINSSEEEGLRSSAELINKNIEEFEKQYAVKDKQDLLAMVALKIASNNFTLERDGVTVNSNIEEDLIEIENIIDKHL